MCILKDLLIPLSSLFVLIVTAIIYYRLLRVSDRTLKFTKSQTSFNIYFDNFKLFNELSKRKIGTVTDDELIFKELKEPFDNLIFENIQFNYWQILLNYPREGKLLVDYSHIFKRFNEKVQTFIDILHKEIISIQEDNDISDKDKKKLTFLYQNYLLYDYIKLSYDLKLNKDLNEKVLTPPDIPDILKCNYNNKMNFDVDKFLALYNWLDKAK
jgi:hypothetical protein